jgi:hypothetical protein
MRVFYNFGAFVEYRKAYFRTDGKIVAFASELKGLYEPSALRGFYPCRYSQLSSPLSTFCGRGVDIGCDLCFYNSNFDFYACEGEQE